MTYAVRTRGAPGLIVSEFVCPGHGVFEAMVPSGTEHWSCSCGYLAPWTPSAPRIKQQLVSFVRGKSDGPPSPYYLDTEPMADGLSDYEFRSKRDKLWDNWRDDQIKKAVS